MLVSLARPTSERRPSRAGRVQLRRQRVQLPAGRMAAVVQMVLGCVLAVLATLVCSLGQSPERAAPTAIALAAAQRWVATPAPSSDENDYAIESDVVDTDDETKLASDEAAPCDLASVLAFSIVLTSQSHQALPGTLPGDGSRFAVGTGLARGPPALA